MADSSSNTTSSVRYEPNENPPIPLSIGLGFQFAILCVGGTVLTPAIVVNAGGGSASYVSWAVFAAVAISGITTIIQAVRVGKIGAGHVLVMGSSGAFIAVCVTAIAQGGPAMLATLVILSSIFQFVLAAKLSFFRRILTPSVAGLVIMLIPVAVMPIIFDLLDDVPEGGVPHGAPVSAFVTVAVILAIALSAKGVMRLWAPVVGVVIGSIVSGFYGLYDVASIASADWIGLPGGDWPGFDLSFGPVFWTLLPAFILVTLIGAVETVGDSIAIQRVSRRSPQAVDFKIVQGAVNADGVGNLLSGIAGTVPNTTYSTSVSVTELTGVGARSVGVALGVIYITLAFVPKGLAVILAIPGPVAAAYLTVLLSLLFVVGMKIIINDGIDYRKGLVVGVAYWVGVGCQADLIFPELLEQYTGEMLKNGMTAGGLTAILMTLFLELIEPKRRKLEVDFNVSSLTEIRKFLGDFSNYCGWDEKMALRLESVSEESLLTLLDGGEKDTKQRLLLNAHKEEGMAVLEFIAGGAEYNLQDRIALLGEEIEDTATERELSIRLLRHMAASVHHQQYHDLDILTLRVEPPS
ncbi:MAG: hypothetical protein OXI60_00225 [Acidiferrobacterales bacterium]|nr:hypothetical protein [Acidiferrobacterales bacterium]